MTLRPSVCCSRGKSESGSLVQLSLARAAAAPRHRSVFCEEAGWGRLDRPWCRHGAYSHAKTVHDRKEARFIVQLVKSRVATGSKIAYTVLRPMLENVK